VSTNLLLNHALGSGWVKELEVECPWSLKVPMDRIYKMLIKTGYKEGNMNFYKYHGEEGHIINQYEGFHNKVIQMMIRWIL
jgi:hypothetical protein